MIRHAYGISLGVLLALSTIISGCASAQTAPARMAAPPKDPFWWSDKTRIDELHKKGKDGKGRTVAILDSGFAAGQKDLDKNRIDPGKKEYCPPGSPPTNVDDFNGHGTAMAVIALGDQQANTPNNRARGGIATKAMLLPIKIVCGVSTADSVTQGVDAAITANVDVILLALGGWPSDVNNKNETVHDRLLPTVTKHSEILFVVASVWDDTTYKPPAWTTKDNVILVAATKLVDSPPSAEDFYSSEKSGDIWAPGKEVETTFIDPPSLPDFGDPHYSGTYEGYLMEGASPAAAIVAGCATAIKNGKETGSDLKTRILKDFVNRKVLPGGKPRLDCAAGLP